nr:unnamed protein product [Digitaria exilis]
MASVEYIIQEVASFPDPCPHEPGTSTIATIRGGIPEIETLDLTALSPKRRNPSPARRGPGGEARSGEEDTETHRGAQGGTGDDPRGRRLTAGGRAPELQRGSGGAGRAEGMEEEEAEARESGDGEKFQGKF